LHAQWEGDDSSATWNCWRQSKSLVSSYLCFHNLPILLCIYIEKSLY
jgi:hypothetical protein